MRLQDHLRKRVKMIVFLVASRVIFSFGGLPHILHSSMNIFIFNFKFRACQAPNPGDTKGHYFPPIEKVSAKHK